MLWLTFRKLNDKNEYIREAAVRKLAQNQHPKIIGLLIGALRDHSEVVRSAAGEVLSSDLYCGRVMDALIQALGDSSKHVRDYRNPQTINLLLFLIGTRSTKRGDFLAARAATTLKKLGYGSKEPKEKVIILSALEKFDELVALGAIGIPPIFEYLREHKGYGFLSGKAEDALLKLEDSQALPFLLEALKDKDVYVRTLAVKALGNMRAAGVESLIPLLRERQLSPWVTRSLARGGDARAVWPLIESLGWLGDEAAEALTELGIPDRRAEGPLIELLRGGCPRSAQAAKKALIRLGDANTAKLVFEVFETETQADAQFYAAQVLEKLADQSLTEKLVDHLKHSTGMVAYRAASILGCIGDRRAVQPLIEAVTTDSNGAQEDKSLSIAAANALGTIADPRAVRTLVDLLSVKRAAKAACRSLENIVEKAAQHISTKELQEIAQMDSITSSEISQEHRDDWAIRDAPYVDSPINCSQLKRLAAEELHRRS